MRIAKGEIKDCFFSELSLETVSLFKHLNHKCVVGDEVNCSEEDRKQPPNARVQSATQALQHWEA